MLADGNIIVDLQDLISMVVEVQNTVEVQGKKISDLETYIDSLLSRVIEVAPVLLHKDVRGQNRLLLLY